MKIHRITADEYADPSLLPIPAWYYVPQEAGFNDDIAQWIHRKAPFGKLSVIVATHWHPDQPTAPTQTPDAQAPACDMPPDDKPQPTAPTVTPEAPAPSSTPRTEERIRTGSGELHDYIHEIADFARQLETELAALQKTIADCEAEVSKVYCELTMNRFSKMNTRAQYIIDRVYELHDEELAAARAVIAKKDEALRIVRNGLYIECEASHDTNKMHGFAVEMADDALALTPENDKKGAT